MDFASSLVARSYKQATHLSFVALSLNVLPDWLVRWGTRHLLASRLKEICHPDGEVQLCRLLDFVHSLKEMPIAVKTDDANKQHYEVPTEFFRLVLGKHLKYSSCYFTSKSSTLNEAEVSMLELYCVRAQLEDGQSVLDVGCGWGSLSLYLAEKYRKSNILGISNSDTQRLYIEEQCKNRGITNLHIITCDITTFSASTKFDRILSIEMFEHMKNYQKLLSKLSSWMKPEGLLFVHTFTHRIACYHFEDKDETDWMSREFFSGGTMASEQLLLYFQDDVTILNQWRVNGKHYARTSNQWLKKMDANVKAVKLIFAETYGEKEVTKWIAFWRTFFIAVEELFGYNDGEEWGVSHYLFRLKK